MMICSTELKNKHIPKNKQRNKQIQKVVVDLIQVLNCNCIADLYYYTSRYLNTHHLELAGKNSAS